ncbi:hypothetical protein RND71_028861 [Anisodus tanguticus]|uniref:LOB domain-containing protein n=1 Tax=Anisodus tanguticus TaxID=243964 RepID=A0AAE1RM24_9SOLA|nr:hypothetical protein RND71_028861 [Anisodus tanguticus]
MLPGAVEVAEMALKLVPRANINGENARPTVLKNVAPSQKDNAMKALIFEANIRAGDPVGGCYRVILNLHRQINLYQAELQFVYREIYLAQAAAIQEQRNIHTMACSIHETNSTMSFDLLPLHGLHGFNRSNSICIGEGSNTQNVKGKGLEGFSSDEEVETKTISSSIDRQSFVEQEDFKPCLGKFHDYKGKGVATGLRSKKALEWGSKKLQDQAEHQSSSSDSAETVFSKVKSAASSKVSPFFQKIKEAKPVDFVNKGYTIILDELKGTPVKEKGPRMQSHPLSKRFTAMSFSLPVFVDEVQEVIRPVLDAFFKGHTEVLKKHCSKEVIERCKAEHQAFDSQGIIFDNKEVMSLSRGNSLLEKCQDTTHTVHYAWAMQLGEDSVWRLREMQQFGIAALI